MFGLLFSFNLIRLQIQIVSLVLVLITKSKRVSIGGFG